MEKIRLAPGGGDLISAWLLGQDNSEDSPFLRKFARPSLALLGNIVTDPLVMFGGGAKALSGLGGAYRALKLGKPAAAGKALLGSPLPFAVYAPELVENVVAGTSAGITELSEGQIEEGLSDIGFAAVSGVFGYLGAKGLHEDLRALGDVRQVVRSTSRERVFQQTLEAAPQVSRPQIDATFDLLDSIATGYRRAYVSGRTPLGTTGDFYADFVGEVQRKTPPRGALEQPPDKLTEALSRVPSPEELLRELYPDFDSQVKLSEGSGELSPEGSGTSALSAEELARVARHEVYYRVNRDGTLTYQGSQPDPGAPLRPGEGIVKVLPGQDPVVTQANGPDSEVLAKFHLEQRHSKTNRLKGGTVRRGTVADIFLTPAADVSTLVHEFAHAFRPILPMVVEPALVAAVERHLGVKKTQWTRKSEEGFARSFEQWLYEGRAPSRDLAEVFSKFRVWLSGVYDFLKTRPLAELSPEQHRAFQQILGFQRPFAPKAQKELEHLEKSLKTHVGQKSIETYKSFSNFIDKIVEPETGDVLIRGFGTPYERLVSLSYDFTPEEIAGMLTRDAEAAGLKSSFTPDEIITFMVGAHESGRALGKLSHVRRLQEEFRQNLLRKARSNPEVERLLRQYDSLLGDLQLSPGEDVVLFARNAWFQADRVGRGLGGLFRSMLAGTVQVAVNNAMNGLLAYGGLVLDHTMLGVYNTFMGRGSDAARHFRTALNTPWALAQSTASAVLDLGIAFKDVFSRQEHLGGTGPVRDMVAFIEKYNKAVAEQLYHRAGPDLTQDRSTGFPLLDRINRKLLIFNLVSDRMIRNGILLSSLEPLLKQYGVQTFQELAKLADTDRRIHSDVGRSVGYASMEALRASGGLLPTRGPVRSFLNIINRLPFAWTVMPFAKYAFANYYPVMLESMPVVHMLSKRARNSTRLPVLKHSLEIERARLKVLKDDARILLKSSEGSELSQRELRRLAQLRADKIQEDVLQQTVELNQAKVDELSAEVRGIQEDGVYDPQMVRAHYVMGPLMIALFAALRTSRGDDGTEHDEMLSSDGKLIDISNVLGPWQIYGLLGDMLGHQTLGTGKYETPEGYARFRDFWEVTTNRRYGQARLSDLMESDRVSWDYLRDVLRKAAANLGRGYGTGAYVGDLARRVEESENPEAGFTRRTDVRGDSDSLLDDVVSGFSTGLQSQVPFARTELPPSPDWAREGRPYQRLDPVESLVGDPLEFEPPGRRTEFSPIRAFISRNRGFISARSVFPERTGDSVYDESLSRHWGDVMRDFMLPTLERIEADSDMSRDDKVRFFTNSMQQARELAHFHAKLDALRGGRSLPAKLHRELVERERERRFKLRYRRLPIPQPPNIALWNQSFLHAEEPALPEPPGETALN